MALTLSSLVKASKRYALNPSISDEVFLNAFLEPYVEAARVKGRGDTDFYLDKSRTSRILKGNVDVPIALRKVSNQHGLERRVSEGCGILFDETIDVYLFEYLKSDIFNLLDASEPMQVQLRKKLEESFNDPPRFLAQAMIAAVKVPNKQVTDVPIWKKGSGSVSWESGDLLHFGFGNRKKTRNLVVIPVDTAFRTHVTRAYEGVDIEEVSERTIHGQWVVRMGQSGVSEKELKNRIDRELSRKDRAILDKDGEWPIGTVVTIDDKRATYVLLAVSRFDEKGMARSSMRDIEDALFSLFRFYDEKGQGMDLFLPLIGTGKSRTGLTPRDSFDLINAVATSKKSFLCGKVTIVVRQEDVAELKLGR